MVLRTFKSKIGIIKWTSQLSFKIIIDKKQAEKLKSRKMKNGLTNGWIFVNVESVTFATKTETAI